MKQEALKKEFTLVCHVEEIANTPTSGMTREQPGHVRQELWPVGTNGGVHIVSDTY